MLGAILVSLRPRQWVKNLFVFGGLIFAQRLFTPAVWPALAAFAIFCGLSGAWLSPRFALAGLAFVALLGPYSVWLKHVVIVDVLVVPIGFVLRPVAGALAIDVAISGWLLICT